MHDVAAQSKTRALFPRRVGVLLLVGALTSLATTPIHAAEAPPFDVYERTDNLVPVGANLRTPDPIGNGNTDLAFWQDTVFQGTYLGFRIIDVSDPMAPTTLLDFEDCGQLPGGQGDLVVWENLLVRTWDVAAFFETGPPPVLPTCDGAPVVPGFEGLHVFDITDPTDPSLVAQVDLECGSHTATGVPDPANDRLLIYSSASSGACAGIDIVEIPLDAPETASFVRREPSGRLCHDTGVILGAAMRAGCAGGNGLTVFSLGGDAGGTLTDPLELWTKSLQGVSIGHSSSFSWDGSIAIFGHEPGGGGQAECEAQDDRVKRTVWFLDSGSGKELGRWVLPRPQTHEENCTVHNFNTVPSATGNFLVSGNYQSGISVVDFTDPARAREIAYADPEPIQPPQAAGDWSAYWYDGHVYESDIARGLLVWELRDPAIAGSETLGHSNPQTQERTIPLVGPVGECRGRPVTIAGSAVSDILKGTRRDDVIMGGRGKDRVSALQGDDIVCGGAGKDVLLGGPGNDVLLGQRGNDTGSGGRGKDRFKGGPGKDIGSGFERGKP